MMKTGILFLAIICLFRTISVYAADVVQAAVSFEGETFNFELAGQKNWDYDLKRIKSGNTTKVQLFVKSLDSASVNGIKNITNPFVENITTTKNVIDNRWLVEFTLKNDRIETFDYLTDQPSKLIVDFYASDAPIESIKEPLKKKVTPALKPKKVAFDSTSGVSRAPADVDYLRIDPDGGIQTSVLSKSGLFDAGDSQFKRFGLNDSEYKEEAIIKSKSNYYLKFPVLETEFSFWKKMKENPPEYDIKAEDNTENKQARLLKTLYTKSRHMVFLQTLEWFKSKYPNSKFLEMLSYMEADVLTKLAHEFKDTVAYEKAQTAYVEALEQYPDSVLAERTSLMTGLLANDHADYMRAIRRLNLHIQNKKYSKNISSAYAKLALAYSLSKVKRINESLEMLSQIEKETKDPLVLTEISVRKGDFNFSNRRFGEAIAGYEKAAKDYPLVPKMFPSAYFNKMEALFWNSKYKESHKAALEFAQYFPSHDFAPYALTRVGELLGIMGADQSKTIGAYLETHFRYGNSPKTIVAKLHLMSTKMKNMKAEELEQTLVNMEELASKSELDNIDQFKVTILADGFSKRKDFTKAIQILSDFYQINPSRPDAKHVTNRIIKNVEDELNSLSEKKDYKTLLKTYKQYADTWLKADKRIDTVNFLGLAYENAGAYEAALEKYKNVETELLKVRGLAAEKEIYINQYVPTLDELYLRIAKSHAENQSPQEAYQYLQKIQRPLELSAPSQVERVSLASKLYESKGDSGTSIRYLSELSNLWNGEEKLSLPVKFKLAEMQISKNDYDGAVETYNKCKDILVKNKEASESDLSKLMNSYSKVLLDNGRNEDTIKMLGEVLDQFTNYPFKEERYLLGDLLFKKGEIKKAEVVWEKIQGDDDIWKKLSQEKLKQAAWDSSYKKHINRIPAMSKKEEMK